MDKSTRGKLIKYLKEVQCLNRDTIYEIIDFILNTSKSNAEQEESTKEVIRNSSKEK